MPVLGLALRPLRRAHLQSASRPANKR